MLVLFFCFLETSLPDLTLLVLVSSVLSSICCKTYYFLCHVLNIDSGIFPDLNCLYCMSTIIIGNSNDTYQYSRLIQHLRNNVSCRIIFILLFINNNTAMAGMAAKSHKDVFFGRVHPHLGLLKVVLYHQYLKYFVSFIWFQVTLYLLE